MEFVTVFIRRGVLMRIITNDGDYLQTGNRWKLIINWVMLFRELFIIVGGFIVVVSDDSRQHSAYRLPPSCCCCCCQVLSSAALRPLLQLITHTYPSSSTHSASAQQTTNIRRRLTYTPIRKHHLCPMTSSVKCQSLIKIITFRRHFFCAGLKRAKTCSRNTKEQTVRVATQYAFAPCKLSIYSQLFARWHLFRHVGYLRH